MHSILLALALIYYGNDYFRKCGPRLSNEAAEKLKNYYLFMRGSNKENQGMEKKSNIPITVR